MAARIRSTATSISFIKYGLCMPLTSISMNVRAASGVFSPRVTKIFANTDDIFNSFRISSTVCSSGVVKRHLFLDSIICITSSPIHYTAKIHRQKPFGNYTERFIFSELLFSLFFVGDDLGFRHYTDFLILPNFILLCGNQVFFDRHFFLQRLYFTLHLVVADDRKHTAEQKSKQCRCQDKQDQWPFSFTKYVIDRHFVNVDNGEHRNNYCKYKSN